MTLGVIIDMPPAGRRGSNVFVVWDLPVVVFLLSPLFVPVAVLDESSVVEASLEVCVAVLSPSVEGPSDELWSSADESSVEVGAERSCEGFGEGASVLPSVCTCGAEYRQSFAGRGDMHSQGKHTSLIKVWYYEIS